MLKYMAGARREHYRPECSERRRKQYDITNLKTLQISVILLKQGQLTPPGSGGIYLSYTADTSY